MNVRICSSVFRRGIDGQLDGAYGEVALRLRASWEPALSALVAAAHAEMVAGFSERALFMDSVEQAMACRW